jgi:hypothetical protein
MVPSPFHRESLEWGRGVLKTVPLTAAAATAVVSLAACGGSSTASKVASAAKRQFDARSASCAKAGIGAIAGQRETIYECRVEHVAPLNRPAGDVSSASLVRCFIYTDGATYDVTKAIAAMHAAGGADGFRCR